MNYYDFESYNNLEYKNSEQICKRQEPTMPPIPEDEGGALVPPAPNIIDKKSTTIMLFSTHDYVELEIDSVTYKTSNIQTLNFGNYPHYTRIKGEDSIDSFSLIRGYAINSFILPEDAVVKNISASIQIPNEYDFEESVFTTRARLYQFDPDKKVYKYIEGTEVVFEPNITGNVKETDMFFALGENLDVLIEKNTRLVLGVFTEAKEYSYSGISVSIQAGISLSIANNTTTPV